MKQNFLDKDWSSLHSVIHKMIPSFSIMGINKEFETMAKKIQEYSSALQKSDTIHDLVLQLENVCSQACLELEEELKIIKNNQK